MTRQRQLVLDIVNTSCVHPTAEQIFFTAKETMPSIVMATVYNNINVLTDQGLIRRVTVHGEPDRYDNVKIPHEHLKCDKCGDICDVFMGDILDELRKKSGINITSYELNMHYICDECRSNEINKL